MKPGNADNLVAPAGKIMSLSDPEQKMSKSHENPNSRLLLSDSSEDMWRKLKIAKTDSVDGVSFDPENRPGVSNLLTIASQLDEKGRSPQDLAAAWAGVSMLELKQNVHQTVDSALKGTRERYKHLIRDENHGELDQIAKQGARNARRRAGATMRRVREAMGR